MDGSITNSVDKHRAYRQRLAAKGNHQLVVALPRETVALLDELKEREGLPNRSQALLQLIEKGRGAAQDN
jgi:ribbon-helix-helix CopG family protein